MQRPSEEHLAPLKRSLLRLSLLDGRLVWCAEGPHLTWLQAVHDPLGLIEEVAQRGRPTVAGLQRAASMLRAPQAVDARWLGAAQRDLKALRHPSALALIAASPRAFRRHGRVDEGWLDARQHVLDALSHQLSTGPVEGTAGLYALAEALHGPGAARALERLEARSRQHGRSRLAEGRRRIAALVARLGPDACPTRLDTCEVPEEVLEGLAGELLQAHRARGRPFERRLRRIVQAVVAWPSPPGTAAQGTALPPLPSGLAEAVRAAGEEALAAQRPTTHHEAPERLGRAVGVLGLMFRPEPEDRLTPADVSLTLKSVEKLREHLAGRRLTVRQVLELLWLDRRRGNSHEELLGPLGELVAGGLELSLVSELVRSGHLSGLIELKDDVEAARAWGQWVLRLAPLLKNAGHELYLMASAFRGIARGREGGLVLLGRCLTRPMSASNPRTLLTWLDVTLGLVRSAPEQARRLHADLMGTTPGLGRRLFPEFAAWLGDDALLDRYCHLRQLAGEPPALSRALLRDFTRAGRRQGEREHLGSREDLTEAQLRRRERLEQRSAADAPCSPEWTRRRLGERLEAVQARAFEVRLDAALAAVLRAGWGIRLPAMTPEWRDAVRFQLSTDQNAELLGTLLRHAAAHPGRPLARVMPANAPWLKRAAKRMDVEAWLTPRSVEVGLGGRRYVLSVEQDPLQVLRMGIPFNTCLSLDRDNGASTVVNALDANKHVLYLRDEAGEIVARKLIAISRDWTLVGYRLYLALEPGLRPEVERAFHAFCVELAARVRLPLAASGVPDTLHPGFWYDDGTVPFTVSEGRVAGAGEALAAYCQHLGRPVMGVEELAGEAAVWFARQREDVAATLAAMGRRYDGAVEAAADWLVERLGEPECLGLAETHPALGMALLRRAFTPDGERMLTLLGRFPQVKYQAWEAAMAMLGLATPSATAVRLLVDLARRQQARSAYFDDHNIEHGTMYVLPSMLARLDVATALELCDRVAPLWDWVVSRSPGCRECRDRAWRQAVLACERAYMRGPDPAAVVHFLADVRRHVSAHRVALHLAGRFPFPRSLRAPAPVPGGLTWFEGVPIGCPAALRVLRERCARDRELAALPEMAAALLRQSGPAAPVAPEQLPEPGAAPFEALGDLQLHLPGHTRQLLSRWDGTPAEERPSLWTLYFHRRQVTAWRRALTRSGAGTLRSRRGWLAVLGDLEGLEEVALQPSTGPEQESGPFLSGCPEGWRDSQRLARFVARQVPAGDEAREPPRRLDGNVPPEVVDAALMRRALRALDEGTRPGAQAEGAGEALEECIDVLAQGHTPQACWMALLEQLLERGAPEALIARATKAAFADTSRGLPEDLEELMVRLAGLPGARRAVVETLSMFEPNSWARVHARLQLAARARGWDAAAFLEEVCTGWVRRFLGSETLDFDTWLPPGLVDALERAALAEGALVCIRLYRALPDLAMASRFLDRMLAALPANVLRQSLVLTPREEQKPDLQLRWLTAALENPPAG